MDVIANLSAELQCTIDLNMTGVQQKTIVAEKVFFKEVGTIVYTKILQGLITHLIGKQSITHFGIRSSMGQKNLEPIL